MNMKMDIPRAAIDAAMRAQWMHTYGVTENPTIEAIRARVEERLTAAIEGFCWHLTENPIIPTKREYKSLEIAVEWKEGDEAKYRSVHHKILCEWVKGMFLSAQQNAIRMEFPGPGVFKIEPDGTFTKIDNGIDLGQREEKSDGTESVSTE